MSNRQARRDQSRSSASQRTRSTRPASRSSKGGGGGGGNIFTPGFLIAGGVAIVALIALFIVFTQVLGGNDSADQDLVDSLVAAEAEFPFDMTDGNTVGSADAPVKVVAYEDIQCPFCLRYTAEVEPTLIDEFVKTGQMQITYKHLPILGKSESTLAALAMTCAADEDKFWQYHHKLFTLQAEEGQWSSEKIDVGRFTEGKLKQYAEEVGIDTSNWDACMQDPDTLTEVSNDAREAQSFGIRSTPGFTVNGQPAGQGSPTIEAWRDIVKQITEGQATPSPTDAAGSPTPAETTTPEATGTPSN